MSRRLSLLGLLGAGLIVVGAATGSATGAASTPSSSGSSTSSPDATSPAESFEIGAAWLNGGRSLALVTWGSSSCVPRSTETPTIADGVLTVSLTESEGTACTRDMVPRPTLVSLPGGVDPTKDLEIAVSGAATGKATLEGLATPVQAEDFTPNAGWVNDSLVAIMTYGSSSCPPSVETVTAEGDAIAVGFATPPADLVCTLDIAPQLSLADVTGIGGPDVSSLVLSGGGVTADGPVPIIGKR